MMLILNILYIAILFAVFVFVLFLSVGLIIWVVRHWYAAHQLTPSPSRRRRALLGFVLLWTATFSGWAKRKKVTGIIVLFLLLLVVFLLWLRSASYADSYENIVYLHLNAARNGWLMDGCPNPPDAERYLGNSPSSTNYVYRTAIIVNGQKYFGLFATRDYGSTNAYVITTTGDVLVLDGSQVHLLIGFKP